MNDLERGDVVHHIRASSKVETCKSKIKDIFTNMQLFLLKLAGAGGLVLTLNYHFRSVAVPI